MRSRFFALAAALALCSCRGARLNVDAAPGTLDVPGQAVCGDKVYANPSRPDNPDQTQPIAAAVETPAKTASPSYASPGNPDGCPVPTPAPLPSGDGGEDVSLPILMSLLGLAFVKAARLG